MSKQLINVGSQANDGTGDSIRVAGQKINSDLNELYNALGDGTSLQVNITGTTVGHVLKSNGTTFVNGQLSYNNLADLPTIPAAQVPSDWNSSSGSSRILNKPTLSTVATTGSYSDLINIPQSFDSSRTSVSGTTSSLANSAAGNIDISNGFKSYALLKVQTSHAAWVTVYADTSSRTSDSSRLEGNAPAAYSGVIADITTTAAQTKIITPGIIGWNNDITPSTNIYLKVVNKSGSSAAITVTISLLRLES